MEYLYSNINELNQVEVVVLHCDDSYFSSRRLPAQYIRDILAVEPIKSNDYRSLVAQMSKLVATDYHEFDRLSKLSQVLFSTYEQDDKTLHIFPDKLLSRSAYETLRERLDEIALSN